MGTRQLPRSALSCAVLALFCALALTSAYAQVDDLDLIHRYDRGLGPDCAAIRNGVWDSACSESETCQSVNGYGLTWWLCVPIGEGGSPGGPTIDEEGEGCLVEGSINFDENAEVPCDNCCEGCLDPDAANYVEGVPIACEGCCEYEGCLVEGSINFDEEADVPCDNCCVGCRDITASNFVEDATIDCGDCCEYEGCLVEGSNNFDENAEVPCDDCCVACLEPEAANFVEGAHIPCNDCCNLQAECDDPEAANYEPLSVLDPCPNRECCVYEGCTDPLADEGSYDPRNTIPCQDSCCLYTGCTDPTADVGYDPKHNVACNECCEYEGCTLVGRVNTDPRANLPCNGDNSCCGDALGLEPSTDLFDLIDVVMGPVGIARRAAGRTAGEIVQMVLENQAEGLAKEAIGGAIDETASGRLERRIDSVNDRVIEGLAPYYEAIEDQIMNDLGGLGEPRIFG